LDFQKLPHRRLLGATAMAAAVAAAGGKIAEVTGLAQSGGN